MTATIAQRATGHVPTAPAPNKHVLKVDLFEETIHRLGLLDLRPVFPYFDDGDLVPCLSVCIGDPNVKQFQFFHANTVSESLLCLAADDMMKPGQLMTLAQTHGVNTFLKDAHDPNSFNIMVITIRMNKERIQDEGLLLRCSKCNAIVFERHVDVKEGPVRAHYPEFHGQAKYTAICEEFNSSEQNRTCPECGHLQDRFPIEQIGWGMYAKNVVAANEGRNVMESYAAKFTETE